MPYPADLQLQTSGFIRSATPNARRSEFADGYIKQRRRFNRRRFVVDATAFVPVAQRAEFEAWVADDLRTGTAWFDYTDPVDGELKQYRIVNGEYSLTAFDDVGFQVSLQLEYYA